MMIKGEGFFTLTNCEYKRGQIVLVDGCRTEREGGWIRIVEEGVGGRLSLFGTEGNSRGGNNNFCNYSKVRHESSQEARFLRCIFICCDNGDMARGTTPDDLGEGGGGGIVF